MRENWQRNAIARGLVNAKADDIILISDLDEIPSPDAVKRIPSGVDVVGFIQMFFNFYLNFWSYTIPYLNIAKAVRYDVFCREDTYATLEQCEYVDPFVNKGPTASKLRRLHPTISLKNGGWHFSYLGDETRIVNKINSIAIEYANEHTSSPAWIKEHILRGDDITECGHKFFAIPLDTRFPAYLLDNREKYSDFVLIPYNGYYKRTRLARVKYWTIGWVRRIGAKLIPRYLKPFLFRMYCVLSKNPIKT